MLPPKAKRSRQKTINKAEVNRRQVVTGLTVAAGLAAFSTPAISINTRPTLVVIGAGAGGAALVREIQTRAPGKFDITIIAKEQTYNAPYALHDFQKIKSGSAHSIDVKRVFEALDVRVFIAEIEKISPKQKTITLQGFKLANMSYDVLVAAPGVALNWDETGLKNATDAAALWTSQATGNELHALLEKVPEGGTFGLVAPAGPHRCPPAVYERACFAAHWFQNKKRDAKILIIDEKDQYPMQALFEEAYADYYNDTVEWVPREFHGGIKTIDLAQGNIETDAELFECDALNVIPPQHAPNFLRSAGLCNEEGYGEISTPSMQSIHSEDIYIIGDAASAGEISKSAMSAGIEARLAATDIIARFTNIPQTEKIPVLDNCWTLVAPNDAISLGGTYASKGTKFVSTQRFMSTVEETEAQRKSQAIAAKKWPREMLRSLYGANSSQ